LSPSEDHDQINIDEQSLKDDFPSVNDTLLLGKLSEKMYSFRDGSETCETITPSLGPDIACHHYEQDEEGTAVLVVSHEKSQLASVIFRGTIDFKNIATDADIVMRPFCIPGEASSDGSDSKKSSLNCDIDKKTSTEVHAGFYDTVFRDGLYGRILEKIVSIKTEHPDYRIITSGHSLGAAASVLTAVALAKASFLSSDERISSISFGCPQIGNKEWNTWVNSQRPNLSIWRYVNKHDVVTRLPGLNFWHVGHTLQMDVDKIRAYFLHYGDDENAGVPSGWSMNSIISSAIGTYEHFLIHYLEYFKDNKPTQGTEFVDKFEKIDTPHENDHVDKSELIKFKHAVLKFAHLEILENFAPLHKILNTPECRKIMDAHMHSLLDKDDWEDIFDRVKDCYEHVTETVR